MSGRAPDFLGVMIKRRNIARKEGEALGILLMTSSALRLYQVVSISQKFPMLPEGQRPSGNIRNYWLRLTT